MIGLLLGVRRHIIGPWAFKENNALVKANQSTHYISYKHNLFIFVRTFDKYKVLLTFLRKPFPITFSNPLTS